VLGNAQFLASHKTGNSRSVFYRKLRQIFDLFENVLECYELTPWQERMKRGPEKLVVDFFAAGLRCGDVQIDLDIGLGEHEIVQSQQPAVNRSRGLDLKRLSYNVPFKPQHVNILNDAACILVEAEIGQPADRKRGECLPLV
jgi:hypothetical protein